MSDYVLPHSNPVERDRLGVMSSMLDPQFWFRLQQAGVAAGWSCLEVAAGNGSVSEWLAGHVGDQGHVVVSDIETSYLERLSAPNLETRKLDVTRDDLGGPYDLVCGRAFLHHIPERLDVIARLAAAVRPGGVIAIEEPDFHPVMATDNATLRAFWQGWLAWSANQGIDYFIGRRVAGVLQREGFEEITAHGETILFNGGSQTAEYWRYTLEELGASMKAEGAVSASVWDDAMALLKNPSFWTWQNSYVTTIARKPKP